MGASFVATCFTHAAQIAVHTKNEERVRGFSSARFLMPARTRRLQIAPANDCRDCTAA